MTADEILSENEYDVHYYGGGRRHILSAMQHFAKQDAIDFLKWYIEKAIVFVRYLSEIKPLVKSDEIEEKLIEFEGKSFDELYNLYLKSK